MVSPEAQSTPNRATMSPAPASWMSTMLSACIRTRRPTLNFRRGTDVEELFALPDAPLVDADVGQLAVRPFLELEGQGDGRSRGVGPELDLASSASRSMAVFVDVPGIGEVADDRVEERLDALVPVGGPHEDRRQLARDRPAADGLVDELLGGPVLEDRGHQLVRVHGGGVEESPPASWRPLRGAPRGSLRRGRPRRRGRRNRRLSSSRGPRRP